MNHFDRSAKNFLFSKNKKGSCKPQVKIRIRFRCEIPNKNHCKMPAEKKINPKSDFKMKLSDVLLDSK